MYVLYGAEACDLYINDPDGFDARQASATPFVAKRKSNTVLNYIASVQAMYKHFGVNARLVPVSLFRRLQNMHDDTHAARSFHIDLELKKIYDTVRALHYWSATKKLMYWTMTLASAACVSEPCHTPAHTRSRTLTPTRIGTHTQ